MGTRVLQSQPTTIIESKESEIFSYTNIRNDVNNIEEKYKGIFLLKLKSGFANNRT